MFLRDVDLDGLATDLGSVLKSKQKSILYFGTGLDWTGLNWTSKTRTCKCGLVKRGLVKRGLVKRGFVK